MGWVSMLPLAPKSLLDADAWQKAAEATPLGLQGVAILGGVLLCLAGARLYRVAVFAPGALLGLVLAEQATRGMDEGLRIGLTLLAAVVGGLLAGVVERLAIAVTGAVVGGWAGWVGWLTTQGAEPDWWIPVICAVGGSIVFPLLFRTSLKLVTPLLGALAIAWGLGRPDSLLLVAGITGVGLAIQLGSGGKKG